METTLAAVQLESGSIVAMIAVGGSMIIAIIGMISSAFNRNTRIKEFEQSRREIAAYVAEGSISPDDAAKMLNAGGKTPPKCD
ncbi:MAG: hypothetical protein SFY96_06360 [Planctomycetota bacterium]|nr:hypothetical protein [Planctomycetota bacterium]